MRVRIGYLARTRQAAVERLYLMRGAEPEALLVTVEDALRRLDVDGLVSVRAEADVHGEKVTHVSVEVGALDVEFVEG